MTATMLVNIDVDNLRKATDFYNWGKIALLADPFGHGICLIEFVGRGYDEIATANDPQPE